MTNPALARSSDVAALLARALAFHQAGQLVQAEQLYRHILQIQPKHYDCLHLLGVMQYQLGRHAEAVRQIDAALKINSSFAPAHNNRANALKELRRYDEALASYDRAIALDSRFADALNNRGVVLYELKRFKEALASYDSAVRLKPDYAEAYNNRGNALNELKQFGEALASYDRAAALDANSAEAFNGRGRALKELGRPHEALSSYDKAIALRSDHAAAFNNRGFVLGELERYDEALECHSKAIELAPDFAEAWNGRGIALYGLKRFEEALASYEKAITLNPDYVEVFNNCGNALRELKRFNEALANCEKAIALWPDYAAAVGNRGIIFYELRRYDEALACFEQAIALKSNDTELYNNRGNVLIKLGRFREAIADFDRAQALRPDQPFLAGLRFHAKMRICDWDSFDGDCAFLASEIESGICSAEPFILLSTPAAPALHRKCAELYVADKCPASPPFWMGERYSHEKIRLAYVSADLREHAVATLAAGLFECHDKSRFETIALSLGPDTHDRMRERLLGSFNRFFDVQSKSDQDIARLMRDLEIDIAVDLNGFTGEARSGIFAFRAAPIQISYIGYAGTLGGRYWDYIIADRFVIPEEFENHYAEKVVYLPGSFMANDDSREIADCTPSRADAGLPERGFVFCCFNNNYKITPDVFNVWMRLLREVPDSVLWLSAGSGAMENLCLAAIKRGIASDRLIFAPRTQSNEDHLARLRLADLFLDTFYYNAHSTACDALWAGLPVLTCPGQTFASRVAGSLLSAIGLPELIASSPAEYEELALKLAYNPAWLASVKQKLAQHRHTYPLFDTKRFTRHIEAAYQTMQESRRRGEPPKSFAVAPIT